MIYLFRIISDEDQDFFRDLVISDKDTFLDFHRTLQENLGYDPTLLASFFITNELWEKQQEITLIDMKEDTDVKAVTMDSANIEDYISGVHQRMIYLFDFFSERAFFMEMIEQSEETTRKKTPFIGQSEGEPPAQLALDLLMGEPGQDFDELDQDPDQGNISLDDIDPDLLEGDLPDDF